MHLYFCCSLTTADSAEASQGQVLYHFAETVITLMHSIFVTHHSVSTNAELILANNTIVINPDCQRILKSVLGRHCAT